jgi:uncharacterized protein (TIGR00661 family)
MARIVYGVSGEGSGHASRARVVLSHLQRQGHDVRVVSYDRGYRDLKGSFDVFETEGLAIATVDNSVSVGKTIAENVSRLLQGHRKARALKRELFEGFQPQCVITDFEPMTAHLANHYDLPLLTIDNQHRMRYMKHPCPRRLQASALMTKTVIRALVPRPDVSLVTTFFFGETLNERTFLFPPILRREVIETSPRPGDHVLVYLTRGFGSFVAMLKEFGRERFLIYGTGESRTEGNLVFKPPSAAGFLEDLAACKAVMATAGFTLITEALHLGKPYLALPMKGQFEQELNGILLAEQGYGKCCGRVTVDAVGDFLYRLPQYRTQLQTWRAADSREIEAKLDELLADECVLARKEESWRSSWPSSSLFRSGPRWPR